MSLCIYQNSENWVARGHTVRGSNWNHRHIWHPGREYEIKEHCKEQNKSKPNKPSKTFPLQKAVMKLVVKWVYLYLNNLVFPSEIFS